MGVENNNGTGAGDADQINVNALESVLANAPQDEDEIMADFEAAFYGDDEGGDDGESDDGKDAGEDGDDDQEGGDDAGEDGAEGGDDGAADGDTQDGDEDGQKQDDTKPGDDNPADQIKALHAEIQKLQAENRKLHGRYGDLNNRLNDVLSGAKEGAERAGGDTPSRQKIAEAMRSAEKMAELQKEFPEWGEALSDGVAAAVDSVREQVNEQIQEAIIEARHPGWKETIQTPEFESWFEQQDEDTKRLAESPRGSDASKVLDLFKKSDLNQRQQGDSQGSDDQDAGLSRQEALRRAVTPTGARAGARRGTKANRSEYEDFLEGFNGA